MIATKTDSTLEVSHSVKYTLLLQQRKVTVTIAVAVSVSVATITCRTPNILVEVCVFVFV